MSEDNNTRPIGKPYHSHGGPMGQAVECMACHEWFGSRSAYNTHIVTDYARGGKRCLTVDEMEHHSNMHLSGGAMWRTGPDLRSEGNMGLTDTAANRLRKGQRK